MIMNIQYHTNDRNNITIGYLRRRTQWWHCRTSNSSRAHSTRDRLTYKMMLVLNSHSNSILHYTANKTRTITFMPPAFRFCPLHSAHQKKSHASSEALPWLTSGVTGGRGFPPPAKKLAWTADAIARAISRSCSTTAGIGQESTFKWILWFLLIEKRLRRSWPLIT